MAALVKVGTARESATPYLTMLQILGLPNVHTEHSDRVARALSWYKSEVGRTSVRVEGLDNATEDIKDFKDVEDLTASDDDDEAIEYTSEDDLDDDDEALEGDDAGLEDVGEAEEIGAARSRRSRRRNDLRALRRAARRRAATRRNRARARQLAAVRDARKMRRNLSRRLRRIRGSRRAPIRRLGSLRA